MDADGSGKQPKRELFFMAKKRWTRRTRRLATATGLASAFAAAALFLAIVQPWNSPEKAYIPGERSEGITSELSLRQPAGAPPLAWTEIGLQSGIEFRHFPFPRSVQLPEDMGSGVAWGDYDGDGDDDLVLVAISGPLDQRKRWRESSVSTKLYRNDEGRFIDVTKETGVGFRGLGMAASFADYDGDGDLDLLVTGYDAVALYRNDEGHFTESAKEAGLDQKGFFSGVAWSDYDLDGDLDLYLCRYVQYDFREEDRTRHTSQYKAVVPFTLNPSSYLPAPNVLYRNEGNGRFTDVTAAAGVANEDGRSLQAVWSDFNGDGLPDLYVANDVSDNAFYLNQGEGVFLDTSHESWIADYRGAMGIALGDVDNDGTQEIFVTHWIAQENALYRKLRPKKPAGPELVETRLAAPGAPPRFIDEADRRGLGQIALDFIGWGTTFLDADLDGRLDLFVATGSTFQDESAPPKLKPMRQLFFWNRQGEEFHETGRETGAFFRSPKTARGLAVSDFDTDGDPDVALLLYGGGVALLRNDQKLGHHWLKLRLAQPTGGNRYAIGAKVKLVAGEKIQVRSVQAGSSYLSQDSMDLLFGLGAQEKIERLEVLWPDGQREVFPVPAIDSRLDLVRGAGSLGSRARVSRKRVSP